MTELSQLKSLLLPQAQLQALLQVVQTALPAESAQIVCATLEVLPQIVQLIERKNMSIQKLRQQLFGASTESRRNLGNPRPEPKPGTRRRKGHGRRGHQHYPGARRTPVPHPTLKAGAPCPECRRGKLRPQSKPAVTVEVTAQPPISAVIHELERLRCDGCGKVFTAPAPPEVKPEKYDASVGVMCGLLRQQIQADAQAERTGIFTSGIVCEGLAHPIRLLFTGRQHAGENLADVLAHREAGLAVPVHMSDGLSRNEPKDHATRPCHCGIHARRNFVDVHGSFPAECQRVLDCFAQIYRVEAQCRQEHLDAMQRLRLHQEQSQPVLEQLRDGFVEQLESRQVEPNSGLGQAMNYMLKRWDLLTRFLREPGVPLDNNITERLLKTSILHRKNSLHYRTAQGAQVGDLFMSIIQTCRANGINPFDYMLQAVRNASAVQADPARWMPWNYTEALATQPDPRPG